VKRRLTYAEAIHIREMVRAGRMTTAYAAQIYRLGQESIRRIVRGETYANPEWDEYGRGIAVPLSPTEEDRLAAQAQESARRFMSMTADVRGETPPEVEKRPNWMDHIAGKPASEPTPARRPPSPDPFRPQTEDLEADAALARLTREIAQVRAPNAADQALEELGEPPPQGRV